MDSVRLVIITNCREQTYIAIFFAVLATWKKKQKSVQTNCRILKSNLMNILKWHQNQRTLNSDTMKGKFNISIENSSAYVSRGVSTFTEINCWYPYLCIYIRIWLKRDACADFCNPFLMATSRAARFLSLAHALDWFSNEFRLRVNQIRLE